MARVWGIGRGGGACLLLQALLLALLARPVLSGQLLLRPELLGTLRRVVVMARLPKLTGTVVVEAPDLHRVFRSGFKTSSEEVGGCGGTPPQTGTHHFG